MSAVTDIFKPKEAKALTPMIAPSVKAEPAGTSAEERLARTGRASLIATSSQGILGNATTGRKQLSV